MYPSCVDQGLDVIDELHVASEVSIIGVKEVGLRRFPTVMESQCNSAWMGGESKVVVFAGRF